MGALPIQWSVHIFCSSNIGWLILGIYTIHIHECRNWERGRAVSFLGFFVSNFSYSVFAACTRYILRCTKFVKLFRLPAIFCKLPTVYSVVKKYGSYGLILKLNDVVRRRKAVLVNLWFLFFILFKFLSSWEKTWIIWTLKVFLSLGMNEGTRTGNQNHNW